MRKLNIALATVLGSVFLVSAAYAVDFKTIFQGIFGGEHFGKLEVSEVAALMKDKSKNVTVFDANPANVRESEGVVQGAKLLSSSGHYDLSELPADKTTKLVFYCHNWL